MTKDDNNQRQQALAALLTEKGFCAFIQPVNDAFQGEYTPDFAKRLEWVSGFSGSAGAGLFLAEPVNGKQAVLWADGRYTLQAEEEVDVDRYEIINPSEQSIAAWIKKNLSGKIAYDPWLHTDAQLKQWQKILQGSGVELVAVDNLIDVIWDDQPQPPAQPIHLHPLEYAGVSFEQKRDQLVNSMKEQGADATILALPDGINWLLNVRGSDIPYNPLVLGYACIDLDGNVHWFVHNPERENELNSNDIKLLNINDIDKNIKVILKDKKAVLCDGSAAAAALINLIEKAGAKHINKPDPTLLPKACKNDVEIEGMRKAHKRDGRALTKFLGWLDDTLPRQVLSELEAANKLEEFRKAESDDYRGASFTTISGAGANGAIVHYRVTEDSNRNIEHGELYLVDSGGQYPDGTTDVTRTIVNGEPTAEMKDRFTRVLKGHIALAMAQFPEGTSGSQLDTLARQYLWEIGCDYDHGTGHGVGSYLCVHEGPQRISKRGGDVPLKAGMILSNEPGYYKAGEYGIRIENLVLVVEVGECEGVNNNSLPSCGGGLGWGKPQKKEMLARARELRKNMTDAEQLLWSILRNKQLAGVKFRRQQTIGNYIVDFYASKHKLVIELDGGQHNEEEARQYDESRTAFLEGEGMTVLRFWNHELLQNTEGVLETILMRITPTRASGSTSPLKGEVKKFLGFETLTLAPIDMRLVDETMLNEAEKAWLEDYHRQVAENNR